MAMKYVKLFEHWLLTEGEDDIDVFVSSSPKKFPVLDTKIEDWIEAGDDSFLVMKSFLQRAKQELGSKEFNINAGESLSVDYKFLQNKFSYSLMLKDAKLKEDMQKIFGKDLDINDLNDIAGKFGFDEGLGEVYIVKEGDCALFFNITEEGVDKNQPITELPIPALVLVQGKNIKFPAKEPIVLGQILSFVNQGIKLENEPILNSKMKDKGLKICSQIFAGEGKSSLGAFASTVKIGGKNFELTSGKDGQGVPLFVANSVEGVCTFKFDSAELQESGKETLKQKALIEKLKKATRSIEIIGHTDSVGKDDYNKTLSEKRAKSVLDFLNTLEEFKSIKAKVTSKGVGSSEPIKDDKKGKDKDAAALNRRVVIMIDDKGPKYDELIK